MATPSRSHATSTPRPTSTPTRAQGSPHPASTATVRGVSHKSPAIKTPTSTYGQSHSISAPSHPSSTPMAALAPYEDALATNSPTAAFTPFLSAPALTPLPIPANLPVSSMKHPTAHAVQDQEAVRVSRLQEITTLLKSKVAGRGITRDGVERVAQLNGLTTLWDDDILTIAGNDYVDLEILFDGVTRDQVNDVSLKLQETRQAEASDILKEDLAGTARSGSEEPWNTLHNFAANLSYLAQLDSLSVGVNCFAAVDGLYASFQKVWEEEKKRLTWKSGLRHLCRGHVGRPRMDEERKLGLTLEYWAEKQHLRQPEVCPGQPEDVKTSYNEYGKSTLATWAARISCEPGYPSLKVSPDWVSSSVLVETLPPSEHDDDKAVSSKPDWLDPEPIVLSGPEGREESDAMEVDGNNITIPRTPNARFVFALDPLLYLPLGIVLTFETKGLAITANESKITSCLGVLQHMHGRRDVAELGGNDHGKTIQLSRTLVTYDRDSQQRVCHHTYAVSSTAAASNSRPWCYPVESVAFAHPRELVELFPVFRQYALMWTLLQRLVDKQAPAADTKDTPVSIRSGSRSATTRPPKTRSNVDAGRHGLEELLDTIGLRIPSEDQGTYIDVTIDFVGSAPALNPKLDLIFPLAGSPSSSTIGTRLAYVSIEIASDGDIRVIATQQLGSLDTEQGRAKMGTVLTLSEDLGVLVEWIRQSGQREREKVVEQKS